VGNGSSINFIDILFMEFDIIIYIFNKSVQNLKKNFIYTIILLI